MCAFFCPQPGKKTGLSASIFFATDGKKGFPLQSLAPHGLAMVLKLLTDVRKGMTADRYQIWRLF
jgi:hypothetical protein